MDLETGSLVQDEEVCFDAIATCCLCFHPIGTSSFGFHWPLSIRFNPLLCAALQRFLQEHHALILARNLILASQPHPSNLILASGRGLILILASRPRPCTHPQMSSHNAKCCLHHAHHTSSCDTHTQTDHIRGSSEVTDAEAAIIRQQQPKQQATQTDHIRGSSEVTDADVTHIHKQITLEAAARSPTRRRQS